MKTTLELPDELMRRVKLRAVYRNQKLKEPPAHPPRPVRLKKLAPLTIDDIEAAIAAGRD